MAITVQGPTGVFQPSYPDIIDKYGVVTKMFTSSFKEYFTSSGAVSYSVAKSLRFRSSASAYLNRTPATATNQKTWTWSGWVKRGTLGATQNLASVNNVGVSLVFYIRFLSTGVLEVFTYDSSGSGAYVWQLQTTQVFRDPAAWYHIVVATDTTQGTASNRVKIYVNGSQITSFAIANYPSASYDTVYNYNGASYVASHVGGSSFYDGELAELNSVDGQALLPTAFGAYSIYNQWLPIRYAGTYGTNGFYLPFTNTASTSTLVADSSGNGNNWTPNNISLTAGSTYDSLTDVPTLTSETVANYAVLNPLDKGTGMGVTDGNLTATVSSAGIVLSTIGVSTGKWYWEMTRNGGTDCVIGIANASVSRTAYLGSDANGWGYIGSNGNKVNAATSAAYGSAYASGVVVGVALDMTAGTLTFYRNNVSQGTAYSSLTGTLFAAFGTGNATDSVFANFGQQPFTYTPPTGFLPLNTFNI